MTFVAKFSKNPKPDIIEDMLDIIINIEMFEKYLERIIKQKLGAYIEGLEQNQFSFGVTLYLMEFLLDYASKLKHGPSED